MDAARIRYNHLLLLVAGLGGLLYGIDIGIISGALPYLEATSGLNANQLSFIVAAVLLGSVISTLFAGALANLSGRKTVMIIGGLLFVISIPMIALANGSELLVLGRLLQGISAGLIGVVVPLYLAECLAASSRGKGTGLFQWLLTLGLFSAALIGYYFSLKVEMIEKLHDASRLFAFKKIAWRSIFWVSLLPGILFVAGSFFVAESPRWLLLRKKKHAARLALARSLSDSQVEIELKNIEEIILAQNSNSGQKKDSLFSRKYMIPFMLSCAILACNQATGINSIIGYNTTILIQAGLSDAGAHLGYVLSTLIIFLSTIIAVALIDKRGRRFLLICGTAGAAISLFCVALCFRGPEQNRVDVKVAAQKMVARSGQTFSLRFGSANALNLFANMKSLEPFSFVLVYSCGGFHAVSKAIRSDDTQANLDIKRDDCLPRNAVMAFFQNPFLSLAKAREAPLIIDNALITPLPSPAAGWRTAICIFSFLFFFSAGPGVCAWLALSELMPARIRSNGMSVALFINTGISTVVAGIFLPTVGRYGYSNVFFAFAGCTVIYFLAAVLFLPETRGKTLEEIEHYFERSSET